MAKHQTEIESLDCATRRLEESIADQERHFQKECRNYEVQLQNLQRQAKQAQEYYEQLRKDTAAAQEQLRSTYMCSRESPQKTPTWLHHFCILQIRRITEFNDGI
ncbi:unnamed protein product [Adineta ricciae]|uniref:Uncharacterized protein n=1 Tax=Adineta ricciae TaxID=249248 RepID=A0A814RVW1_ADIRI|nr:unnamed protein product [Adineta ricciae]CAF1362377.1 unnamed protein product [Adineta ricciae]